MHYVIVWQADDKVEVRLKRLLDRGAGQGLIAIDGHHVRLLKMVEGGSPKGAWYDALPIWSAIYETARHALATGERIAEMHVMFIFHQTSEPAVKSIMGALALLTPDALDDLARSRSKNLHVEQVVLLSCESGTDKVVPSPPPPHLDRWIRQARDMRNACFRAFTIKRVDGAGDLVPTVVTFSTGDAVTGGVVLDPWNPGFVSLHGHFDANGNWEYDLNPDGTPNHTQDPAGGTVYADAPGMTPAANAIPAGQPVPPLLPPFTGAP